MSALEQIVVTGCPTCGAPAQAIAEGEGVRYRHVDTATLKAAQGGVTEAMVERAFQAMDAVFAAKWPDREPLDDAEKALACEGLRAALEAALSAEPAAQGEAKPAAWCDDVRPGLPWRVTPDASVVAQLRKDGGYEVEPLYTAPPAQPAERVPDGWKLVPIDATPAMQAAGGHANSEWLNDNAPMGESRYGGPVMRSVWDAMLAATPAAPAEEGDAR